MSDDLDAAMQPYLDEILAVFEGESPSVAMAILNRAMELLLPLAELEQLEECDPEEIPHG